MDITAIITAHREGLLANPSCRSLELAKAAAEEAGITVEVLVLLDRPDGQTLEFFVHRIPRDWKLIQVDFGDLGHARNEGVRLARGRWIAFLDADDLFGKNWLRAAHVVAMRETRLIVWHPEISIYFGNDERVFIHVDMEDEGISAEGLMCANYWTALCFAPRSLLDRVKYPETAIQEQIGYEDWTWNREAIAHGAIHKIVSGTGHFIRVKQSGSLLRKSSGNNCIPRPSDYLLDKLRRKST